MLGIFAGLLFQSLETQAARQVIALDGTWQIAEGKLDQPPAQFERTVPVPGLVDMAVPAFESPGSTVALAERRERKRPADPKREAFWYRRTFTVTGPLPAMAKLKVNKARYGTKVILNGQVLGEHGPNFTPGWFDARAALQTGPNEVLIRVGASLAQVPPHLTEGWDFEKSRYIPGLYDSVELMLADLPFISSVQVVPDLSNHQVRVRAWLQAARIGEVWFEVREVKSGKVVWRASTNRRPASLSMGTKGQVEEQELDATLQIPDSHPWSPEDPFLYALTVRTSGDEFTTRFGMREFKFDPATGRALLNGKPYYLRGSNVCIYRFFEDAARAGLPWDRDWVRKLHQRFKEMHWNSLRYCIGFPPELWYEVADEAGVLIQDEFPIWYGGNPTAWPKEITQQHLAVEFTEWMRERWNHPCVVIWDAQNETTDDAVVAATLMAVRGLDLSQRPWDNGWGTPQKPGDISEAHPYRANRNGFFANFANETGIPDNGPKKKDAARPPYLINEYGWLWINRDGTLPTLTVEVYKRLLGEKATVAERFHYYARTLAAKTEFWRAKRQCAGVLHFCGLGYSRADGQTSDHFTDVKNLVYEPNFFRYVRDAFAPVGLMLDAWAENYPAGKAQEFPVVVINDLEAPWKNYVQFRLLRDGKEIAEQTLPVEVAGFGTNRVSFTAAIPEQPGNYQAVATLLDTPCGAVHSLRDFSVLTAEQIAARKGIAVGKPVKALSSIHRDGATGPEAAVDGDPGTRWSSEFSDPQWLAIDLGAPTKISGVELVWEGAYATAYAIEVSSDGKQWTKVYQTKTGKGGTDVIHFAPVETRFVRYFGTKRATQYGHSLWEFRVFPAL